MRSILISSKSLFSKKIRQNLMIKSALCAPFDGITLPKSEKNRYKSEINPHLILQQGLADLATTPTQTGHPMLMVEGFKILLLALGAGLRRDEIDTLQWQQINWQNRTIRVETNEYTAVKSPESEAEVRVDPALLEWLKQYIPAPGAGSPFVVESDVQPRPGAITYHHYRCDRHFKRVISWLHSKGVTSRNAIHALRKEFGSQICSIGGIFAASVALRHSNINITRDYYLDSKEQPIFPIGSLFPTKMTALCAA